MFMLKSLHLVAFVRSLYSILYLHLVVIKMVFISFDYHFTKVVCLNDLELLVMLIITDFVYRCLFLQTCIMIGLAFMQLIKLFIR